MSPYWKFPLKMKVRWLCFSVLFLFSPALTASAQSFSVLYSRVPNGSPDGTVWIAASDGSSDEQITTGEWPRLSPDGGFIVFKRGPSPDVNRKDVYVRNLQTGDEALVFSNNDFVVNFDWTADGSQIVFDYFCEIDIMNRDGSDRRQLIQVDCFDDAPQLNPVDGRIAFHNLHFGLFLANPDGSNRTQVPNTVPNDLWPSWSPDGEWIAFGHSPNGDLGSLVNYYKVRPDGSDLTQLTFLSDPDRLGPAGPWTSDETQIVVAGNIAGVQGLYAIATDGSGTLTALPTSDGDAIDFAGSVAGP